MFHFPYSVSFLILFALQLLFALSYGQKCSLVTKDDLVRCENLSNLTILETSIRRNWNKVQITNRASATLTIADPVNATRFSGVTLLDLSKAGRLVTQPTLYFAQFPALTTLNLSNTKLTSINGQWFMATNRLRTLDLSRNRITSLTRAQLQNMTKLQELNLSGNDILSTSSTIFADLKRLRTLHFNANRLSRINLGPLPSLLSLSLANNLIVTLTLDSFRGMESLEEVHLQGNRITSLPMNVFGNLSNLHLLNLTHNQISRIRARTFSGLESIDLQILDLSNNGLTQIDPSGLFGLNQLWNLNLSRNSLHNSLDQNTFKGLRYLRTLDLSENQMDSLAVNTFQPLTRLESLDLSQNNLEVLSGDVFGTAGRQLKQLILTRNNLLEIDGAALENLDSLKFLNLDYNALHHLPETLFANSFQLKQLILNDNSLEELSGTHFAELNQLEILFLHRNRLTYFPQPRGILPKLTRLSVSNNPWQCKCLNDLLSWAERKQVVYSSTVFNGERPVCVATKASPGNSNSTCFRDTNWATLNNIIALYEDAIAVHEAEIQQANEDAGIQQES